MKELIKITEKDGKQVVSARELYEFLGYNKAHWAKWYRKNIEYNEFAIEGIDYQTLTLSVNGNETKDFALIIDFAKKISMMARTKKGEDARDYFIACEKIAKNPANAVSKIDLAKMVIEAEEEKKQLQEQNETLLLQNEQSKKEIAELKPNADYAKTVLKATVLLNN